MRATLTKALPIVAVAAAGLSSAALADAPTAAPFEVKAEEIDDLKPVYATVRSKDMIEARVRTPGSIASLKVDEGAAVEAGQLIATVADPKIALRIKALDAQIVAANSRLDNAKAELDRAETLKARGVSPQARLDTAQTSYDVAVNELKAARAEKSVVETQIEEGNVLAPSAGRVLKVPVTEGSVVMAGESVATIAANAYLLRLELPERHARFIKAGDPVHLGERGLSNNTSTLAEGKIVQVYPELQNGRVVADAEVAGLGNYFVGERVRTWISAGKRPGFVIPRRLVFNRYGIDYVRVERAGGAATDVVVQTGNAVDQDHMEILAGVEAGDKLVTP